MRDALVFTRLYLPRPPEARTVTQLLTRLMASDVPRPTIFEIHARPDGLAWLMGCGTSAVQRMKRLLRGAVAGVAFEAAVRADVAAVSRVVAHPAVLPLGPVDPEQLLAALYQALASRRGDEHVALQLIVSRTRSAHTIPPNIADPTQPVVAQMLDGSRPATPDTRRRMQQRADGPAIATTLRIGVTAETHKRTFGLIWEVFGALQLLEAPGLRLSLNRDTKARWQAASPRAALSLSAQELTPLLGWPVGDPDYPGVPGTHPKRLSVPEIVSRSESVFALSTAPGPDRLIGIDPKSRLQHLVVTGPTGSGKSTVLEHLILSDIRAGRACVVIEPKRQLVDNILNALEPSDAEHVVLLDASDADAPVGFNPLDVGDRDPDIVVDNLIAALAAVFDDGWGPRTEYLIHGALLSLARAGRQRTDPYTLIDLPRLLTDVTFRRPVVAAVHDDSILAAFWAEFEDLRPGQRAAQIAAPLNKLRKLLLRKPLVAVLGQSRPRFRVRDVFRERKTVLVPLNDALIGAGAARLLGSLLVADIFMATIERAAEQNPQKRPGMVFIDEVQNYLHLPTSVGDAMGVFRSYGVGLHIAHQHRAQLPAAMRADVDVNARSKVVFALQPDDARDVARMTPTLTTDDFQQLARYEIYTHLIAGEMPVGWCSGRTLPPARRVGKARLIRLASRRQYGALPPVELAGRRPTSEASATSTTSHQKARRP